MKILMIAPAYAPSQGGVEKHIQNVTRELVRQGHRVVVLVRHGGYLPEHQVVDGADVWRLPKSASSPVLAWWYAWRRPVFEGVNVVHSHDVYPRNLRKLLPKVRWVHTFHGYEGWPLDPAAIASRQAVRREVDYCFGVGAYIEKWYGTKLDAVTYGADGGGDEAKAAAGAAEVVFVGRLEPDTGFREYLEGFRLMHKRHPKVRLAVLGEGSLRSWGEQYVEQYGLPVSFEGWVADHAGYRAGAKVLFVSGYLAILEAAALGKPVVAQYNTPIKKDYLECHPLARDLVIASTPAEVASGYDRALKTPENSLKEAQTWAQAQTWEKLAKMYLEAYKEQ